jgi:hypothetical protein
VTEGARQPERGVGEFGIRAVAWLVSGFAIACACLGVLLLVLNGVGIGTKEFDYSAAAAVLGVSFSAVGGLIASQRPGNPIGWLFLTVGFSQGLDAFDTQYGRYALMTNPGALPGGSLMGFGCHPGPSSLGLAWLPPSRSCCSPRAVCRRLGGAGFLGLLPPPSRLWSYPRLCLPRSPEGGFSCLRNWACYS